MSKSCLSTTGLFSDLHIKAVRDAIKAIMICHNCLKQIM